MVFGFDSEDFDAAPVGQALGAVGDRLRERFADVPGPVTFYARYDEQAGQLRCSVASAEPDGLPFGGRSRPVSTPAPALALMAADDTDPGVVPWTDLEGASAEETADPDEGAGRPFPVFTVRLTRS
ncbi:hypothetical protein [Planomonospora alba]